MLTSEQGRQGGRHGCGAVARKRRQRHRSENALLYQLVADLYPHFVDQMEQEGRWLPSYVREEFEAYLRCGRLEHGFLRVPGQAARGFQL